MKGHPLLWGAEAGVPPWSQGQPSPELQRQRVTEIMQRYRGKIEFLEVVNEPAHVVEPKIDQSYRWAREAKCRFRLEREPVFRRQGGRSVGCGASRLLGLGGCESPWNRGSGDAAEVDGSRWEGEFVSSGPEVELIASRAAGEAAVDVPLEIHGEPRRQDGWAVPQRALAAKLGPPSTQGWVIQLVRPDRGVDVGHQAGAPLGTTAINDFVHQVGGLRP